MNQLLDQTQYRQLTLYIRYVNDTSVTLNGDEAINYFYNKIAMDIYTKQQSTVEATKAQMEANIKWILSWFAFYLFCRMVFYILKRLFGAGGKRPIRVVVNDYR